MVKSSLLVATQVPVAADPRGLRRLPDGELWPRLTQFPRKAAALSVDGYFRRSWSDLAEVHGPDAVGRVLEHAALLLLKPEALAGRRAGIIVQRVMAAGFQPVYARRVAFSSHAVMGAWQEQMDVATDDRIALRTEYQPRTPGLLVGLRSLEARPSATALLSSLKGSPHAQRQRPGDLRSGLGSPNPMINFLHAPDELADLIRDLGIWLPQAERIRCLRALGAHSRIRDWLEVIRRHERAVTEHDLDLPRALGRFAGPRFPFGQDQQGGVRLGELIARARVLGVPTASWDFFLVASQLITWSLPPLRPAPYTPPWAIDLGGTDD